MFTGLYYKSFWSTKTKLSTIKMLLIATMCIVCDEIADLCDQKRKWTDPGVDNDNPMSASIDFVDNLCKRFGQNKVKKILALFVLT